MAARDTAEKRGRRAHRSTGRTNVSTTSQSRHPERVQHPKYVTRSLDPRRDVLPADAYTQWHLLQ